MRRAGYEPVTGPGAPTGARMTSAQAMAMLGGGVNGVRAYDDDDEDDDEADEGVHGDDDEGDTEGSDEEEITGAAANGLSNGIHAPTNGVGKKKGRKGGDADAAEAEWVAAKQGELDAAEARLAAAEAHAASVAAKAVAAGGGHRMQRDEVEEGDIARVISKWTGIPISKLVSTEREKLLSIGR